MPVLPYKISFEDKLFGFIPIRFKTTVYGGPYVMVQEETDWSMCLKAEASSAERQSSDWYLPIEDFSIPKFDEEVRMALFEIWTHALAGKTVGAGCMGGTGRTGLILALMAKVGGCDSPLTDVRAKYKPHAVETKAQAAYLAEFDVSKIRKKLHRMVVRSWIKQKLSF